MIPLKDDLPTERLPVLTIALLIANIAIFLMGTFGTVVVGDTVIQKNQLWALEYGTYPCELISDCDGHDQVSKVSGENENGDIITVPIPDHNPLLSLITSAFLHGGWQHLVFNMLFLWIYGNNVEDSMSRPRFAAFYLLGAVVSALAQAVVDVHSTVPQIGASGAIAACIGAYLMLYPRVYILAVIPLPPLGWPIRIPAVIVAGIWGLGQFVQSLDSLYAPAEGGVAYLAHLGGFLFGLAVIHLIATRKAIYDEMYMARYRYG